MNPLTQYRLNETSLSPVRGKGMVSCKLFDFLNLGINNEYVTFGIHKGVSGNDIPNIKASVCKASFICGFLKTKCRHIRFNHNHRSRMCISYSWLANYWLYGTPIKACKSMKAISCVREYLVVHQNLSEQGNYASTVQKIVHFINSICRYIGVVFITAGPGDSKIEYLHHGNPKPMFLCHLLSSTLLGIEVCHICLANSTLRFIYCAKSFEFIGDCCDTAIFRILRSVTSL